MTRRIVSYQDIGPGGVVVVGPMGSLRIVTFDDGTMTIDRCVNCDFVGTAGPISDAHKALVDERWRDRTDTGRVVDPRSSVKIDMPDALSSAFTGPTSEIPPVPRFSPRLMPDPVVAKDKPAVRAPWWRFWK
jgi:hypothetical protein